MLFDKIKQTAIQHDQQDLKVRRSWVEYDTQGRLDALCFEMDVDDQGQIQTIYKAIKLYRLVRTPKSIKLMKNFMDIAADVISGMYQSNINFLQIMANILKPKAIGLLFCYGVQGVSYTSIDEAKKEARAHFTALGRLFAGAFRTIELRLPTHEEIEWLRNKMHTMKHVQMVRGLPLARKGVGDFNNSSMNGSIGAFESQETNEEFIAGMSDFEFVSVVLAQPVEQSVLLNWLTLTQKDQTNWNGLMQGSKGINFGLSMPFMFGSSLGTSEGTSLSRSDGYNYGISEGYSEGTSTGTSYGYSSGTGTSDGTSKNYGENVGYNEGDSYNYGTNKGTSDSYSEGTNYGKSIGTNEGTNDGWSTGYGFNTSNSTGYSGGTGTNEGISKGDNYGKTEGMTIGGNVNAVPGLGMNFNRSDSITEGTSLTESTGKSTSDGYSLSNGSGESWNKGASGGTSKGTSESENWGTSKGISRGINEGTSEGWGASTGKSTGSSWGTGSSTGTSTSQGENWGINNGTSAGYNKGYSEGTSVSDSRGISSGTSAGTSGSVGLGPSIGYSKSYQWKDSEVETVVELLEFQRQRLIAATNGQGAFFTDFFIATDTEDAKAAAKSLAIAAWVNDSAYTSPLQVLDANPNEEQYLLFHMNAFSPSHAKDDYAGVESYRYSTVLLADELTAYAHPPRISEGGLFAEVEDMPVLSVPSNRQDGEIYVGTVLSGERYSIERGYETPFPFKLRNDELMHAFFSGGSRSGKTVAATRVVAELANNIRRGPNQKRMRVIVLDPKQDWRILARFVEPERFRFYSLADPRFLPAKINLCKIPKNVWPERYMDNLIEIYCRSYGLMERGKSILRRAFYDEYSKVGCFDDDWEQFASERSATITMETIYRNLEAQRDEMNDKNNRQNFGNDARDALARVLDRMEAWGRKNSILNRVFCDPSGQGIDELLGADDVVVLESYGLESTSRSFIFGLITSGIYSYCVHNGGFVNPPDQYETVIVIEEANEVLLGQDGGGKDGLAGPSEFERILDQAAGNGLFIWAITQKISMMPTSIIANCGIVFAGRQKILKDVQVIMEQIGRDSRYDDRPIVKWLPVSPTGWFIVQTSRSFDFKESQPTLVKVEALNVKPPTNDELIHLMTMQKFKKNQ